MEKAKPSAITLRPDSDEESQTWAADARAARVSLNAWIIDACNRKLHGDKLNEQLEIAAERERLMLTMLAQATSMIQQLSERAELDFNRVDEDVLDVLLDAGFSIAEDQQ